MRSMRMTPTLMMMEAREMVVRKESGNSESISSTVVLALNMGS